MGKIQARVCALESSMPQLSVAQLSLAGAHAEVPSGHQSSKLPLCKKASPLQKTWMRLSAVGALLASRSHTLRLRKSIVLALDPVAVAYLPHLRPNKGLGFRQRLARLFLVFCYPHSGEYQLRTETPLSQGQDLSALCRSTDFGRFAEALETSCKNSGIVLGMSENKRTPEKKTSGANFLPAKGKKAKPEPVADKGFFDSLVKRASQPTGKPDGKTSASQSNPSAETQNQKKRVKT